MKLLIISNMYPSVKDPVYGTFVQLFAKQMINYNGDINTSLIVIKGRDGNIFNKMWKYFSFYLKITLSLILYKYDLVYIHTITYPVPPIRIASFFRKLPLVFNVHGGDVLTRSKFAEKLKKKSIPLLKMAKLIVSPSNYFKTIILKEFPFLDEKKIYVSPSGGIKSSFFTTQQEINNDIFTLGYVSRIDEAKGWDTFINAIAILKAKKHRIKAIMVGRGSKTNEMNNLIHSLSLNNEINYIGPIPHNQLPEIYANLDLFIFPTELEESLGLVGLEAMACKVPVIGSNIGGLKDYIKPHNNGLFFEAGNSAELAEKIIFYMSLSEIEKNIYKENAYKTAKSFSSDTVNIELYYKLKSII